MDAAALFAAIPVALPFARVIAAVESRLREIELGQIDQYTSKLN